jgi:hypothetical protein
MAIDRDTLQLVRKILRLPAWALIRMPVFADVLREHLEWDVAIDEIVWRLARDAEAADKGHEAGAMTVDDCFRIAALLTGHTISLRNG